MPPIELGALSEFLHFGFHIVAKLKFDPTKTLDFADPRETADLWHSRGGALPASSGRDTPIVGYRPELCDHRGTEAIQTAH